MAQEERADPYHFIANPITDDQLKDVDVPWVVSKTTRSLTTPDFVVVAREHLETGFPSWYNTFLAFRLFRKDEQSFTRVKLSFRKYQKVDGKWVRRQNYNLNRIEEARLMLKMIRTYFPELADE